VCVKERTFDRCTACGSLQMIKVCFSDLQYSTFRTTGRGKPLSYKTPQESRPITLRRLALPPLRGGPQNCWNRLSRVFQKAGETQESPEHSPSCLSSKCPWQDPAEVWCVSPCLFPSSVVFRCDVCFADTSFASRNRAVTPSPKTHEVKSQEHYSKWFVWSAPTAVDMTSIL
jgi:hypothetical protein